jgi:low affinity Fe/Cu permease
MEKQFVQFASAAAKISGKPWTFIACLALVIGWAVSGPLFGFGQTWQLLINTTTTIITFLMVFLIQNTQNRDAAAIHAKLDELLFASRYADVGFIGIEHLTDSQLAQVLDEVERRAHEIHLGHPARPVRKQGAKRHKAEPDLSAYGVQSGGQPETPPVPPVSDAVDTDGRGENPKAS